MKVAQIWHKNYFSNSSFQLTHYVILACSLLNYFPLHFGSNLPPHPMSNCPKVLENTLLTTIQNGYHTFSHRESLHQAFVLYLEERPIRPMHGLILTMSPLSYAVISFFRKIKTVIYIPSYNYRVIKILFN